MYFINLCKKTIAHMMVSKTSILKANFDCLYVRIEKGMDKNIKDDRCI
jgi:hypothetical protein